MGIKNLRRNYVVPKVELQKRLQSEFSDNTISVETTHDSLNDNHLLVVRSLSPLQEMPSRPLCEIKIEEHLGGGAKPVVKLGKRLWARTAWHHEKDVADTIANAIMELHRVE